VPTKALALTVTALCACGSDAPDAEIVVRDARLSGAPPVVIGATTNSVSWSASAGGTTLVAAADLATLPATGQQLASSSGPVAAAGDFVVFATGGNIARASLQQAEQRLTSGVPEALGGSTDAPPIIGWTSGPVVSWGTDDAQMTATLTRVDRCDHVRVTTDQVYVAADGASGRRLIRIDQRTAQISPVTASSTWDTMFPGGPMDGSTYRGRIVDANDNGVLWLVEEMPSGRGIVVNAPLQGDPAVLLQYTTSATGFFASADTLYWQEDDALLAAPRTGGSASIVATLPGPAGAFAAGYIYFIDDAAIARMRIE
jgi:hypothetical protein